MSYIEPKTSTEDFVPELDRWPLWQVVKSLDLPYRRLIELLKLLDITVYTDEAGKEYISKWAFRDMLYEAAGTTFYSPEAMPKHP